MVYDFEFGEIGEVPAFPDRISTDLSDLARSVRPMIVYDNTHVSNLDQRVAQLRKSATSSSDLGSSEIVDIIDDLHATLTQYQRTPVTLNVNGTSTLPVVDPDNLAYVDASEVCSFDDPAATSIQLLPGETAYKNHFRSILNNDGDSLPFRIMSAASWLMSNVDYLLQNGSQAHNILADHRHAVVELAQSYIQALKNVSQWETDSRDQIALYQREVIDWSTSLMYGIDQISNFVTEYETRVSDVNDTISSLNELYHRQILPERIEDIMYSTHSDESKASLLRDLYDEQVGEMVDVANVVTTKSQFERATVFSTHLAQFCNDSTMLGKMARAVEHDVGLRIGYFARNDPEYVLRTV